MATNPTFSPRISGSRDGVNKAKPEIESRFTSSETMALAEPAAPLLSLLEAYSCASSYFPSLVDDALNTNQQTTNLCSTSFPLGARVLGWLWRHKWDKSFFFYGSTGFSAAVGPPSLKTCLSYLFQVVYGLFANPRYKSADK